MLIPFRRFTLIFTDRVTSQTKVKFCTDGMLMREMMLDPLLTAYSVVMLDEAHERTIYNDILFGLLKKIMRKRKVEKYLCFARFFAPRCGIMLPTK